MVVGPPSYPSCQGVAWLLDGQHHGDEAKGDQLNAVQWQQLCQPLAQCSLVACVRSAISINEMHTENRAGAVAHSRLDGRRQHGAAAQLCSSILNREEWLSWLFWWSRGHGLADTADSRGSHFHTHAMEAADGASAPHDNQHAAAPAQHELVNQHSLVPGCCHAAIGWYATQNSTSTASSVS
jgi:hypothetical protein